MIVLILFHPNVRRFNFPSIRIPAYPNARPFKCPSIQILSCPNANLEPSSSNHQQHAIQYLFPSGLFESQSRPVMRPPREIYPKFQKAYYDKSGRPFSSFFYTGFQNYYESLYELYANYEELNRLEDANNAAGIQPTEADRFDALTNVVLSKQQLEDLFVEKISDGRYESFVGHLNRLIDHPYSAQKAEFLKRFTKTKQIQMLREQLYTMGQDENGRVYSEAIGSRKNTQCKVRVYKDGTGKFLMNDRYDLNYFTYFLHREQILTPLVMADLVDKVDIYATLNPINLQTYFAQVEELDPKAQLTNAGTVRLGVSRALCAFVDDATKELLRVNGLLQPDLRTRERKKPGLYRARKKPPHRKR